MSEAKRRTIRRIENSYSLNLPDNEAVVEQLQKESERGAILVGAHLLHRKLHELLLIKMHEFNKSTFSEIQITDKMSGDTIETIVQPSTKTTDFLEDGSFLGSFSTSIKTAWIFGFIDEDMYKCINCVRKIRNGFAHSIEDVKLASSIECEDEIGKNLTKALDLSSSVSFPSGIKLDKENDNDEDYKNGFIRVIQSCYIRLHFEVIGRVSPSRLVPNYKDGGKKSEEENKL